ncbi:MAG: 50S ribosomal protein L21 [Candidatus Dormiibacterota bacterium]
MPTSSGTLTAVVVSGGKQYRVAPGDRLLVDRLAALPGAELTLDRVLLVSDGDDVKVTPEALQGMQVGARVVAHPRGKKIQVLRYKPKKRVRVHRGARADLTELEILSVGPAPKPRSKKSSSSAEEES